MKDWFDIWFIPGPTDIVAYISIERIAEIGGCSDGNWSPAQVNQGNGELARWCRVYCKEPGKPVNIKGRAAWIFKYVQDAVLFKLTWGG